jgi:hypothetical protein
MESEVVFIFGVSCNGVDKDNRVATYTYFNIARELANETKGVILQHIRAKKLKADVFIAQLGTYTTLSILEKSQLPGRAAPSNISLLRQPAVPSRQKAVG